MDETRLPDGGFRSEQCVRGQLRSDPTASSRSLRDAHVFHVLLAEELRPGLLGPAEDEFAGRPHDLSARVVREAGGLEVLDDRMGVERVRMRRPGKGWR
jgi:hypothetical protein